MTPTIAPAALIGNWFSASPLARLLAESSWLYPTVETLHVLGFVLLAGSIAVVDLRLLGLGRTLSASALMRLVLPWTVGSLLVVVPTGLMLFTANAAELIGNRTFLIKLLLLSLVATNALIYHAGTHQSVRAWDQNISPPRAARLSAALSLLLWVAIITAGRLIAYT